MKDILYYLQLPEYGILHASQYDNPLLFFSDWETTSGAYHADSSRGLVKLRANYHTLNSNLAMPREVEPFHSNEDLIHAFEKGEIHVGTMDSESFRNIKRSLPHSGALEIFNHSSGAIIHLVLNANHKKFRSKLNRQWVHRKVLEGLHVPLQDSDLYTKALQYYAPESKGFLHQNEIAGIVNRMPGGAVPEELSGGLVINAPKGIKKYLSSRFIEEMEKALGIKVDLRFDIDTPIYTKFLNDRKFEAMLTINTMSYKVFSEALGHAYTSSAPKFLDPSFRMRTLLTEYSLTHEPGEEMLLIHQILLTIIDDSECVPLAYLNKPKFFNTRVLDISQLDPREPLRLWKLKMRSTPK